MTIKTRIFIFCFAWLCCIFWMAADRDSFAQRQQQPRQSATAEAGAEGSESERPEFQRPDYKTTPYPRSLFFTQSEVSAINRALLGFGPSSTDAKDDGKRRTDPRYLNLSGVLYKSPDEWVIWLNGQRLTPDRLLPEIIEINVSPSKIEMKWFDYGISDVIFITLRPHQFYDIETGILLPGRG
ncbi:MAG: hypothetical protein EA357_07220 [Micavibrio sp.]|jgi:hypothetical protein|nr:MAG: hypothetical protein EA357_07220 [Micavibrio sp.]